MSLSEEFQSYIKEEDLFHAKDKLLLAVSGGVDSVVLCELCKQAGYDFIIAHCNFQLRGEESERDERFVCGLAKRYGVEVLVKKFATEEYAASNKLSIQVAARELRYNWFDELIHNKQLPIADRLLTAHHANDNMETMLMNFFRGTGINGLKAMLPKQGKVSRPLLSTTRKEIEQFATEQGLEWMEDSSNAADKYTRNYFRNQLIPGLQKVFPQAEENMLENLHRFRDIDMLYQQAIGLHKKKLVEHKGTEAHIPVLKLLKAEPLPTILYEIIKEYGFTAHQTREAMALLKTETGKYIRSSTHRIIRNRGWLIISPNETREAEHVLIEGEGSWQFALGSLQIKKISGNLNIEPAYRQAGKEQGRLKDPMTNDLMTHNLITTDPMTAQLDASLIHFPLLLRKWKQGDYFYPLGMKKKKKLSRFFIDQKLSLTQKEKVWVIEMNRKIIWVMGMRIDDRFRIMENTKEVLRFTLVGSK